LKTLGPIGKNSITARIIKYTRSPGGVAERGREQGGWEGGRNGPNNICTYE
jgi:hypothetical protein